MELLQSYTNLSIFLYSLDQNQPPCCRPWFRGYVYHLPRWVSPLRRLSRVPKQTPQQSQLQLEYSWETHQIPTEMTRITQWSSNWQHISSRYWIIRRRTWDYLRWLAKVNTTVSLKSNFSNEQHIDGLVQDCSNPSALALGLLQYCTKLSIFPFREISRNL